MQKGPNRDFPNFLSGIGQRLEFERNLAQLPVNALAERSGVNRSTIRALEHGRRNPSVQVLWQLAQALRIDFRDLVPPLWVETRGPRAIEIHQQLVSAPIAPAPLAGQARFHTVVESKMSKSDRNTGKAWSQKDVQDMKKLASENTPTRVIGLKLGRTESAVYSKASEKNVPLKPTNQSPYNRRGR